MKRLKTSPEWYGEHVTVLNYSGGAQSTALLHMVLRGEVRRPDPFLVLSADPGMEDTETYRHIRGMQERCREAGIEAVTVPGPNLYEDLVGLQKSGRTRVDNPPYWTRNRKTGKMGRLMQKCTRFYKVEPMDRYLRQWLEEHCGVSSKSRRLGTDVVTKWIGFTFCEAMRMKPSRQKYVRFAYPLIDMRMKKADVVRYYEDRGLELPPRSVCRGCFANGLDLYKRMYETSPADWEKAVAVDRAVRDMSQVGIEDEVFVSATLLPLAELPARGFVAGDGEDRERYGCDSGYCFT